jgi:hypothetical protein
MDLDRCIAVCVILPATVAAEDRPEVTLTRGLRGLRNDELKNDQ